jgi:hypothetical protein
MLALYGLFGAGLFVIVAGGVATWLFLQTEQGQKVVQGVEQAAEWMTEAIQAPGTTELRAAGCEMALVSEASQAADLFRTLLPSQEQTSQMLEQMEAAGNLRERQLVMCSIASADRADPSCEELAQTYGEAVHRPSESFFLVVIRQSDDSPQCQGLYSADGTLLETIEL